MEKALAQKKASLCVRRERRGELDKLGREKRRRYREDALVELFMAHKE